MSSRNAFTLLEVLLAIVLLAIVVGVCVPFLKGRAADDLAALQSDFCAQVAQAIAADSLSQAGPMTIDTFIGLAQSQGWSCRQVQPRSTPEGFAESLGEWVVISDGVHSTFHWAELGPDVEQAP